MKILQDGIIKRLGQYDKRKEKFLSSLPYSKNGLPSAVKVFSQGQKSNKPENPFQTVTSQEIVHITPIAPFDFKFSFHTDCDFVMISY